MDLSRLYFSLLSLSAYKPLAEQAVLKEYIALLAALERQDAPAALDHYTGVFYRLKQEGYRSLGDWLWDALRYEDSPFGRLLSRGGTDADLFAAAEADIAALRAAADLPCSALIGALSGLVPALVPPHSLPSWPSGAPFDGASLADFYRQNGCGRFARYRAFRWENGELVGIARPDSPAPEALYGYDDQRRQVYDNTTALLQGQRVNHVLLYGDSGTGKSATVKSLLSRPDARALRLVEMDKDHLEDIPALVRQLEDLPQKFILFIDDLAFDQDDKTYSQLKTILEGSLAHQPTNVVVYATSNRRNLVRQTFSERAGDEVDRGETIAEKTSLAERFGTRVAFFALTPKEFLATVEHLARLYGLQEDKEALLQRAKQWELRHVGRTPRVAKQFILHELQQQK